MVLIQEIVYLERRTNWITLRNQLDNIMCE